ncbi:hypothetical protein GALMADRAFT_280944 [Galerina marginata CBS 339.88]|uniref:Uncharacterized protein n=1 Tax=Galerina marginata (strain CBS 339.88) TaxID=685588 RepID=A0A067ST23_GALM3|nr:hypothetical protein GALMADRAFT_280944 [Galerina marginata CBS 339.88]
MIWKEQALIFNTKFYIPKNEGKLSKYPMPKLQYPHRSENTNRHGFHNALGEREIPTSANGPYGNIVKLLSIIRSRGIGADNDAKNADKEGDDGKFEGFKAIQFVSFRREGVFFQAPVGDSRRPVQVNSSGGLAGLVSEDEALVPRASRRDFICDERKSLSIQMGWIQKQKSKMLFSVDVIACRLGEREKEYQFHSALELGKSEKVEDGEVMSKFGRQGNKFSKYAPVGHKLLAFLLLCPRRRGGSTTAAAEEAED